jgi:dTDP-glucose pyrophosphorylase
VAAGAETTKVVVLARGLGKRMRKADENAGVASPQAAVADIGLKAMIPIDRPFLDYVLSTCADAGLTDVCLVIGPEHQQMRDYYEREISPTRIRIRFAIQEKPLGTANAVLAAEGFAGGDSFVVLNSDNYYPKVALDALHELNEPAIVGFERATLIRLGNVSEDRAKRFGALDIYPDLYLRRILSAPTEEMLRAATLIYSSMNCFLFTPEIFRACREVPLSARREYELPQAVHFAMDHYSARFKVVKVTAPVLDMSVRSDIALVAEHLRGMDVKL